MGSSGFVSASGVPAAGNLSKRIFFKNFKASNNSPITIDKKGKKKLLGKRQKRGKRGNKAGRERVKWKK